MFCHVPASKVGVFSHIVLILASLLLLEWLYWMVYLTLESRLQKISSMDQQPSFPKLNLLTGRCYMGTEVKMAEEIIYSDAQTVVYMSCSLLSVTAACSESQHCTDIAALGCRPQKIHFTHNYPLKINYEKVLLASSIILAHWPTICWKRNWYRKRDKREFGKQL